MVSRAGRAARDAAWPTYLLLLTYCLLPYWRLTCGAIMTCLACCSVSSVSGESTSSSAFSKSTSGSQPSPFSSR